jgi:hypothetical protein
MTTSRHSQPSRDPVQKLIQRAEVEALLMQPAADLASRREPEVAAAALAYERLLELLETCDSEQVSRLAEVMAAFYDWTRFSLPTRHLGSFDPKIDDDMLTVLRGFRWSHGLYEHVSDGERRTGKALERWGAFDASR